MASQLQFGAFSPSAPFHLRAAVDIWNAACGGDLAISERFAAFNLQPCRGEVMEGRLATVDGEPAGFVVASALRGEPLVNSHGEGWVCAIAVAPQAQAQGIGGGLLTWAEEWLQTQGCTRVRLGGSLRPFAPGIPEETNAAAFFARRGYDQVYAAHDMAANLATYAPPPTVREVDAAARPAQRGEEEVLLAFLRREFPGRWRYEAEEFLATGGRIGDFMLLWTARGVDGCCRMTFEDSAWPMERFYPYRLPRPWGQVGSIGISADCRGKGYGAYLLDAALRRLHDNGVNGCVIDWTGLVDFYGKFGFEVYRSYRCTTRDLPR